MWGGTGDSRHFLHDGRADFGHHIEIVSDSEDAREFRGESGEGWDGLHALRTVLTTELGFAFSDRRASGGALISAPVAYRVRREGVSMRHWVRRSDGSRLAFQALGPRDAPVLLMLQGQANSHRWWDRIRADFAADWLTVTFDYRGTGATESLDERQRPTWSTALFADDAAAVIEATGRHNAAVYATSMGGRVAQELALRHPKSVTALVLACTSPGGWLAFERTEAIRRSLANSDVRIRSQVMTDLFYTGDWIRSYGGYDGVPTDLLGDTTMSAAARRGQLRVSDEHDAGDRLFAITSPTLVMHGRDDVMVPPRNADVLGSLIPGARRLLLPGRHGFFDEFRDTVSPLVGRFLRERALEFDLPASDLECDVAGSAKDRA